MVLFLEVPLAGIALVLSVLGWKTLRTIRHWDVGKSFWVPVMMSGIFFFVGSAVAILNDLGFLFDYSVEFASVSRLLGLCTLLAGVFTYSRQISKNLAEKLIPPARPAIIEAQEETELPKTAVERFDEKQSAEEVSCKHDLGYLKTLPKNTPIPDECLSCPQIIECKHSYLRKPERNSSASSSKHHSDMLVLDANPEEETVPEP